MITNTEHRDLKDLYCLSVGRAGIRKCTGTTHEEIEMAPRKTEKNKPAPPRVKVADLDPGTNSGKSGPKGGTEVKRFDIIAAFPKKY